MESLGRRVRRFRLAGRRRRDAAPLPSHSPPIRSDRSDDVVSCCYKDFKIFALNEPLFRLGRRYDSVLRFWFSMGVGFGLAALLLVSSGLLLQLFPNAYADRLASALFGFSFYPGISPSGFAHVLLSTVFSVTVHEFGHALAAACEGVSVEYIAVFVAALFPGALVAFNHDVLQSLPRHSVLRVYCAGIWHNAVFCVACVFALFLLPLLLHPFYIHGERPMVLDVAPTSPVFGYLTSGDIILSLDGVHVHNPEEWLDVASLLGTRWSQGTDSLLYPKSLKGVHGGISYCVPRSVIEENEVSAFDSQRYQCPPELTAFEPIECTFFAGPYKMDSNTSVPGKGRSVLCLNPKHVVKLTKCGEGSLASIDNRTCICSQGEFCLGPVQLPGLTWTEITYLTPVLRECFNTIGNSISSSTGALHSMKNNCSRTFVYVGDVLSMAQSVKLTPYQPRWGYYVLARLPDLLERSLICTFHVSLAMILLNSLPVFYLDGESISETALCYFTWLSPRIREKALRVFLLGGTFISILAFIRFILVGLR